MINYLSKCKRCAGESEQDEEAKINVIILKFY